jgi:hypothetical protein
LETPKPFSKLSEGELAMLILLGSLKDSLPLWLHKKLTLQFGTGKSNAQFGLMKKQCHFEKMLFCNMRSTKSVFQTLHILPLKTYIYASQFPQNSTLTQVTKMQMNPVSFSMLLRISTTQTY